MARLLGMFDLYIMLYSVILIELSRMSRGRVSSPQRCWRTGNRSFARDNSHHRYTKRIKLWDYDSFVSIYKYNPLYQPPFSRLIASSQVDREFRCECQKTKIKIKSRETIPYRYILSRRLSSGTFDTFRAHHVGARSRRHQSKVIEVLTT